MSEHMFGVQKGRLTKVQGNQYDQIAKRHGGGFVGPVKLPGNEVKGWFWCENQGDFANQRKAQAILEECGLA